MGQCINHKRTDNTDTFTFSHLKPPFSSRKARISGLKHILEVRIQWEQNQKNPPDYSDPEDYQRA